jgi:glycosyltransferase involved in cell wall biosynthesis
MTDKNLTVVYAVRNNYHVFRMSIESLFHYIPKEHYEEILIVDDCSNDKISVEWLNYLNTLDKVRIIRPLEPREIGYYNNYGRGSEAVKKATGKDVLCSMGHGVSLNKAIPETKTRYMMTVDSDIIFLPKSKDLIPQMIHCFGLDEKILSVGQASGRIKGIQVVHEKKTYVKDSYNPLAPYGFTNSCLMINDMKSWTDYNLHWFTNGGWAHSQYLHSIFDNGFKTCNFDAFVDKYAIHLGYTTLRDSRLQKGTRTFGFAKGGTYGTLRPRADLLVDYYGGYHEISLTTNDLENLLRKEYVIPFEERKCVVERVV